LPRPATGLREALVTLVSFDIDGTMVFGDPPGRVTLELVLRAKQLGYIVGSASDRPRSNQQELWDLHAIEVDFVSHKHHLDQIRARFPARRYVHIGDTEVDKYFAELHGFDFYFVHELPEDGTDGWIF
jgi:hypothetical protein